MTTPLRVLIVEDSPDDAELMALHLAEEGFQPEWQQVQTEPDYRAALETPPDLILADWSLPQFSGLRALRLMRERGLEVPFVIVSGSIGEEAAIEAMRQGACDYVLKDRPARLGQAVKRALEEKQLRDERQEAERALVYEHDLLHTLMDNLPDAIYFKDTDSRLTRINKAQAERFGLSDPVQAIGKTDFDFFTKEHARPAYEDEQAIIRSGQPLVGKEEKETWPDGRTGWVSTTKMPLRDQEGRIVGTFGVSRDITERKRAERVLQESEEKYRSLFEEALDAIVVASAETGLITDCNRTATLLWGREKSELVGQHQRTLHPPEETGGEFSRTFQQHLREKRGQVLEAQIVTKNGETRDVEIMANVFELGSQRFIQGIFRDITERKRAEKALRQRTRSLALINQANRAFSSTLDSNQVLAIVLEEARHLLDIAASSIWLVDPETQELVCCHATGPKHKSVIGWRLAPGEGIAGWVATHGESLIVPNIEKDERHFADVNQHIGLKVHSILSIPLRVKQSVIGVLQMLDVEVGRFEAEDLQVLEPLAASAAIAIENARLYQQAQKELSERKRAEEALRESEEKYRNVVERANDGITILQDSLVQYVNLRLAEMWGGSAEEMIGSQFTDYVDREELPKVVERHRQRMAGESVMPVYETVLKRKNGEKVYAELNAGVITYQGKSADLVIIRDITERKQAEVALQHYVERLRILRAIDGVILAAQSPQEIGQAVLRHMQKLVPSNRVLISSFDLEKGQATVLASLAGDESWLEAGTQIELEAFGSIEDLLRGKISIVGDTQAHNEVSLEQPSLLVEGICSYIHIPLIAQSGLIGSILLAAERPAAFTNEHVEVASELSGQLAIGIHQARLREQVQHHTQELEQQVAARTAQLARRTTQIRVAAEVARDAITAYDLDELLNRSVNLVQDRFGFYHAGLFLIDAQGEYAVLRSATGKAGQKMLESKHKLKVGQVGIVGHVCASGEPRIALDVGADATYFDNPFLPDTRSEMALPMRVGGKTIGALDVQSTKATAFDQDDIDILQVMADQLAVAIERTRLFEQMQAALEERLRTVVSHMPVMLFALDREGVFTLAEGKGLDVLEITPADLVGRSVFEVYGDVSQVPDAVRSAMDGRASALTVEIEDLALDMWCSPLQNAEGQITGVLGVAIDVTERRHLEEQMQRQERLAAVGQLAGGIAHDFNNFLMTIVFYAHLLLRDKDAPPDTASIAETIVGEANRAAALVRQVLDFSRRSVMDTQPVDLAAFVEEVMDILQKTLPENIRVTMEIGNDDYTVEVDPTRIQQVIMNLALNARDAMPSGGQLRIGLSRMTVRPEGVKLTEISDPELAAGDWVRLSVVDTGVGMDEHVRAHLFEPFFTTKGPKGNGLGLAQVYGIVKQHQGEIGVETEIGSGTTFQIYLPAYKTKNHQTAGAEEISSGIPEGRGETILFIEDEDKVRDAGQRVLQSLGYRVLTASNGREGIEMFRKTDKVDLVLTDMIMPEMGGREVIEQLKQLAPGIKALVVTGYTMQEDIQALKEAGFVDIVYKPLDVSLLGRTLRRILDAENE
jgi:PAS domain S-box-containing protein